MKSFDEITVGQYQDLYKIQKSDLDDLDKITESVAVLTGKSNRQVEEMSIPEFNRVANSIVTVLKQADLKASPKEVIDANGKKYGICYQPAKLRAGQYVEIQHFIRTGQDMIENLHLIMASIAYPVKKDWLGWKRLPNDSSQHPQVAEDMRDARFVDVYSACVFFCQLLIDSIKGLEKYLKKEMRKRNLTDQEQILTDLMSNLGGYMRLSKLPTLKT